MQKTTQYFSVADHLFAIRATQEHIDEMVNMHPFLYNGIGQDCLFVINVESGPLPASDGWVEQYIDRFDADMPRIEIYRKNGDWLFMLSFTRDSESVCAIRCTENMQVCSLFFLPGCMRFAMDNATMLLFAFRTVDKTTLLFHSSVTVRGNYGYMFLGHSGTGKSTHSQQWLNTFEDAWLLNDDNPVVRIFADRTVQVYGTPWSGKTPCYKQEKLPVAALVQLEQAPENEIEKLKMTRAYPYILASVSGMKLDPLMMDSLYETIAQLLEIVPVYKLRCLPNAQAALLCAQTCLPGLCHKA